jgi:glycosyltransferase involved in cell wall biosynthesis
MKVSVVIRTYNRPDFLIQALASVQLQTHKDWEVIIFDDAASDVNFNIYKNFKLQNKDKRVLYITTNSEYDLFKNSWILAPDLVYGEIMVRLDDDDLLVEDALEFLAEVYTTNTELEFTYGSGVFFRDSKLETLICTKNPFEHPATKDMWAPYTIPNNHPWREPWTFIHNFYDEPKSFTSIIHAAKANAFCIYHTYVMRTSSIKKVKDKITITSKFVDDLEFLGSLDNLGLGFNSIKKILCYVRIHNQGRVTDNDRVVDNTNMWQENFRIRDKVDELRTSGFISKVIPIKADKNKNDGLTDELQTNFVSFLGKINQISNSLIIN